MRLTFEVDGTTMELSRDVFMGRCTLKSGTESIVLEPWEFFSMELTRRWQRSIKGHDVVVEKERPLLLAGLRPQTYRVFVDGKLVQERKGF